MKIALYDAVGFHLRIKTRYRKSHNIGIISRDTGHKLGTLALYCVSSGLIGRLARCYIVTYLFIGKLCKMNGCRFGKAVFLGLSAVIIYKSNTRYYLMFTARKLS